MSPKSILKAIRPHLRNPEFIRELSEYLSNLGDQNSDFKMSYNEIPKQIDFEKIHPRIFIEGRSIFCDGRKLDLSCRAKIFDLFSIFLRSNHHFVTKKELLLLLYNYGYAETLSSRLQTSTNNKLMKLLSRSRIVAASTFGSTRTLGLEWFVYDSRRDGWYLYRISNTYRRQLIKP